MKQWKEPNTWNESDTIWKHLKLVAMSPCFVPSKQSLHMKGRVGLSVRRGAKGVMGYCMPVMSQTQLLDM
jgi:hypothetical protein